MTSSEFKGPGEGRNASGQRARSRKLGQASADRGPVACQSHQGKVNPIEMVFQIEHSRESGPCKAGFVPGAVAILCIKQVTDTLLNCLAPRSACGNKSQHSPSGL